MSNDCIEPVPHAITGPDGVAVAWRAPACGTCEGAVQGDCPCPPPFCDEATALFIEPGATVQYAWSGLAHVAEDIPPACPGIDMCGSTCERSVVPPAGAYSFAIQAGGASGCSTEPCECTPKQGSCTLLDPEMTFTGLADFDAALELPGGSSVEIVVN